MYSPAPGFRSPSPSFSQSSLKYDDDSSEAEPAYAPTAAPDDAAGTPGPPSAAPTAEQGADTVTCLWDDCGIVFTHLPTLIEHIHSSESSPPYPYTPMTRPSQPTSVFTNQTTLVNGPRAIAVDSLRRRVSLSSRISVRTRARSPLYVPGQASRVVPTSCPSTDLAKSATNPLPAPMPSQSTCASSTTCPHPHRAGVGPASASVVTRLNPVPQM